MTDTQKVSSSSDNQEITATITALSDKGEGLLKWNSFEVYIKNAVPQDVLRLRVLKPFVEGSKRRPAEILSVVTRSPQREEERLICPHQLECGGCPLGLLRPQSQYEYKQGLIVDALNKVGVSDFFLHPFVHTQGEISRYKSIRFFKGSGETLHQGFYQSRSHELCDVVQCPRESTWFGELAEAIAQKAREMELNAYDERLERGQLRALMMRDCFADERLAVLTYNDILPERFIAELEKLYFQYKVKAGFIQCNQNSDNRIMAGPLQALTEDTAVNAQLGDFEFRVGPATFLQVNYEIAQKLYVVALNWCGQDPNLEALDLCCGCGTMTLPLSQRFKRVTGVEIVKEAVEAAKNNALHAGIDNVDFIAADLKKVLPSLAKKDLAAVIADPPRAGLGEANCKVLGVLPKGVKLALIFCGLKALSRDLKALKKSGFKLQSVQGFDMFPGSMGCETLCLLVKE